VAKERILVIDDEEDMLENCNRILNRLGYEPLLESDPQKAVHRFEQEQPVLTLTDLRMPGMDGLAVLREIRRIDPEALVILFTAFATVETAVEAVKEGAFDYIPKPFSRPELLARVEVLARRRVGRSEETVYRVGNLELDRLSHQVTRGGEEIALQPREFRLLEYLMKHAGQVVTRTMLLENVWDYHFDPQTNVIDVHISRLRAKIDKGFAQPLLHTVRGAGYVIRDGAR